MWYICTMEYYSTIKKDEIIPFAATCMDLEIIIPSDVSPKVKMKVKSLSRVRLFGTLWTVAHQAPLSMGIPRQEHGSGLPFPPPEDLPDPGMELTSPALSGGFLATEPWGEPSHDKNWLLSLWALCCPQVSNVCFLVPKTILFLLACYATREHK